MKFTLQANLLLALFILAALTSCGDDDEENGTIHDTIRLSANEPYDYFINYFDDESTFEIITHPENYVVSEIVYVSNKAYYRYTPEQDFIGENNVILYQSNSLNTPDGDIVPETFTELTIIVE